MLTCELITSPDDKESILKKSLCDQSLWVVSDLQSKFWLQRRMREEGEKTLSSERVLRASELWHSLFLRQAPTWQVISPQVSLFIVEKWMKKYPKISPRDRQKAFDTVTQLLPILTHVEGREVLDEWFSEREEAFARWGEWHELSFFLWEKFKNQKLIPSDWVSGLLLHEDFKMINQQPLIFDLGIALGDVESELILNLSRDVDVTVIVPFEEGDENTSAYEPLLGRAQNNKYKSQPSDPQRVFKKLPTMLSEVKEAVGQIRLWVDQGTAMDDIAILSPAIENYWPTLSEYLLVEGISFRKAIVAPLSQFDQYNGWLSSLRLSLQDADSIDGQQYFFLNKEEPSFSFEKYQQLFSHIYSQEDFFRDEEIKKQWPQVTSQGELTFSQFIQWAIELWPHSNTSSLDGLLQNFDELLLLKEKLSLTKWVEYLEIFFSRKEKTLEPECDEGVYVLAPQAAENIPFKKIIFLGLSEKNLSQQSQTSLQLSDIESLKIQFGFSLPHAEKQGKLFQIKWVTEKKYDEALFLHSETDFTGRFQSPSLFWLQQALEKGEDLELQSPLQTRWDELMESNRFTSSQESPFGESTVLAMESLVDREETGQVNLIPQTKVGLSASMLQEYFQCPFKFYSQKVLGLSSLPSLDLDIDYMTRGRLLHKICELIVLENRFSLKDEELVELIEKSKEQIEMNFGDEKLWPAMRGFYLNLAKSFMEFERVWREEHPQTQTAHVELPIGGFIREEGSELFSVEETSGSHSFRGMIDRVDRDSEGQFFVLDYKSSESGISQYKSWVEKGELQLALYSMALEQGLGKERGSVLGAFYYVVKDHNRNRGFNINKNTDFFPAGKLNDEDKEKIYCEIRELTQDLIKNINGGEFSPNPQDEKVCISCQWRALCRNPQLSQ